MVEPRAHFVGNSTDINYHTIPEQVILDITHFLLRGRQRIKYLRRQVIEEGNFEELGIHGRIINVREHWLDKSPRFLFFRDLVPNEATSQPGFRRAVGRFEFACAFTPSEESKSPKTSTPLRHLLLTYGARAKHVIELAVVSGIGTGNGKVREFWTELGDMMLAVCAQRDSEWRDKAAELGDAATAAELLKAMKAHTLW